MFTVEFEDEEAIITLIDSTGVVPDVQVVFDNEGVLLTQVDELDNFEILNQVMLPYAMLEELKLAYNQSPGAYYSDTI